MMTLTENAAYIKGLAEGLELDATKPEGKLIEKILEVLADISAEIASIREDHDDLSSYVEAIDNDLSDLEDAVFEDDDFEGEDDEEMDDEE